MPDPPEPSRRSSRKPAPKVRLAESDDDNTSIDTPPSKTTINKRKSNDDNNNSSKAAKLTTTTTTHTSITTEADKIKNKALFNKFNSSISIVKIVGDVGYEFNKLFGDGNLYAGFVTEIRSGAVGGKDRRCVYEDGDLEDLSMEELESFASNTDDTNNNNSTSADGTSTSISTALKFNNKTGDDRTTTGAVNNNMEVDKVNNNMEVDKVNDSADVEMNEGRDEFLSGSAAVPTTNTPPEESSIGISGTDGSTLTVTLTMDSSIAEKGGDNTSCAAASANNDWSQELKDDPLAKPSPCGEYVDCDACAGKKNAKTDGRIKSRTPYAPHRWFDHIKTKAHIGNAYMKKAGDDREDAPPELQSTSMLSFFKTLPKKKKKTNGSKVVDSTAAAADKIARRLKLMYKHCFMPSRDPGKGYSATFSDFYDYTRHGVNEDLMEGTVPLDDGEYVANQMWKVVSELITYSSDMMDDLFTTLGVTEDEKSPFCRSFSSLDDLMNEFIRYLPRTFNFSGNQGNGDETTNEEGDDADHPSQDDDDDANRQHLLVDRINRFAQEMSESDDDDNNGLSDDKDKSSESSDSASAVPTVLTANSQDLMTRFRAITSVDNIDDISEKVLAASSCLEGKVNMQGAASLDRKSKSLVQRWLAKPEKVKDSPLDDVGDVLIKRDTVILVNVKIGRGAAASTVPRPFRVLDIYDKHYNKWFMSKESQYPVKIWNKVGTKPYKLKIRMLERDAVNEYSDVGLYGSVYEKKSICQIIQHSKIIGVVGTLQHVA